MTLTQSYVNTYWRFSVTSTWWLIRWWIGFVASTQNFLHVHRIILKSCHWISTIL